MFVRICLFLTLISLLGVLVFPILAINLSIIWFAYLSAFSFLAGLLGSGLLAIIHAVNS